MTTPDSLNSLRSSRSRIAKPLKRPHGSAIRTRGLRSGTQRVLPLRSSEGDENDQQTKLRACDTSAPPESTNASTTVPDGASDGVPDDGARAQEPELASRDWVNYLGHEHPLRVLFVGHNPSDRSWDVCAPYAHGSNKFWKLLAESALVPETLSSPSKFTELPVALGLGFVDLFVTRGSDARVVERRARKDAGWRGGFVQRVLAGTAGRPPKILACVSKIVAQQLLLKWKGDYGPVGLGSQWNLAGLEQVQFWVLPSTSARAVLSHESRLAPFVALKQHLDRELPWDPPKRTP